MNYKNPIDIIQDDYTEFKGEEDIQGHFQTLLLMLRELPSNDERNQDVYLQMMIKISNFIDSHKNKFIPDMPKSMEYFFSEFFFSSEDDSIYLPYFFKLINFITLNKSIDKSGEGNPCERLIKVNLHSNFIQKLFENKFSNEYLTDLIFATFHLIDFLFQSHFSFEFANDFFEKYPISSFMSLKIDVIDRINFLIIFSKHNYLPEIAQEIVLCASKIPIVEEIADQFAWIMYYTVKNNINNSIFLFSHPNIPNQKSNIFFQITELLNSREIKERFCISYIKFCVEFLHHANQQEQKDQIKVLVESEIPFKIKNNFALLESSSKCKELYLKFIIALIDTGNNLFTDDFLLDLLNLSINSKLFVKKQILILYTKILQNGSTYLNSKFMESDFFVDCLVSLNADINIFLVVKTIFLVYENIETNSELFNEYLEILDEYDVISAFHLAIDSFKPERRDENYNHMINYIGKLESAISASRSMTD